MLIYILEYSGILFLNELRNINKTEQTTGVKSWIGFHLEKLSMTELEWILNGMEMELLL